MLFVMRKSHNRHYVITMRFSHTQLQRTVVVTIMDNQEQAAQKPKRLKIAIIVLAVLLVLSAGGLGARMIYLNVFAPAQAIVTVPDNLIGEEPSSAPAGNGTESSTSATSSDTGSAQPSENVTGSTTVAPRPAGTRPAGTDKPTAPKLELYEDKPGDNQKFEVSNMFPGDTETKYFCVKTYHDKDISLFFRATVTEQTKVLGNVLHIKVTHMNTGKVLCDAAFSEIDGRELSELLKENAADETTAYYQIDVSLDTTVGNEYQAALLKADFAWYVKDEGGLTPPPQTGDSFNLLLWITLAASSLLLMILLWKRRKEDEQHEQAE